MIYTYLYYIFYTYEPFSITIDTYTLSYMYVYCSGYVYAWHKWVDHLTDRTIYRLLSTSFCLEKRGREERQMSRGILYLKIQFIFEFSLVVLNKFSFSARTNIIFFERAFLQYFTTGEKQSAWRTRFVAFKESKLYSKYIHII